MEEETHSLDPMFAPSHFLQMPLLAHFEVCHGLPSLHILSPTGDLLAKGTKPTTTFALGFVQSAKKQELNHSLGDMLGDFFEFPSLRACLIWGIILSPC